jgi:hypothetical protein
VAGRGAGDAPRGGPLADQISRTALETIAAGKSGGSVGGRLVAVSASVSPRGTEGEPASRALAELRPVPLSVVPQYGYVLPVAAGELAAPCSRDADRAHGLPTQVRDVAAPLAAALPHDCRGRAHS